MVRWSLAEAARKDCALVQVNSTSRNQQRSRLSIHDLLGTERSIGYSSSTGKLAIQYPLVANRVGNQQIFMNPS